MDHNIHTYIAPGRRAHLVGIGGVSMSPLAEVLHGAGMVITGSDMREGTAVAHLRSLGIPVAIGHREENVGDAELVIRTAAVHDSNPEIAAARARGIPVFERAQAWGAIMKGYQNALCISGTHGKTTTTSMCTHIIMAAGLDPTVMIGGTLPLLGAGHRVGAGDTIILESCEYCNSFLSFFPTIAVILNIEADHLDFFKDLEDVESSFRAFADLVPEGGRIIANRDDENTMHTLAGETRPVTTFGLEEGDVHAAGLTWSKGLPSFDIILRGERFAHVSLRVPGLHNVKNALAAAAAAAALGVSGEAVERGLGQFGGAGRRFEACAHDVAVREDQIGQDAVAEVNAFMGSEDFASFSYQVPIAYLLLGAGTNQENEAYGKPMHNQGVVFNEDILSLGSSILTICAMNWLSKHRDD